jgi:hypothetical protein
MTDDRQTLEDIAGALYFAADWIADLVERDEQRQADVPDEQWMRGARRELSELIREVEGPNPPQAPRRGT